MIPGLCETVCLLQQQEHEHARLCVGAWFSSLASWIIFWLPNYANNEVQESNHLFGCNILMVRQVQNGKLDRMNF